MVVDSAPRGSIIPGTKTLRTKQISLSACVAHNDDLCPESLGTMLCWSTGRGDESDNAVLFQYRPQAVLLPRGRLSTVPERVLLHETIYLALELVYRLGSMRCPCCGII